MRRGEEVAGEEREAREEGEEMVKERRSAVEGECRSARWTLLHSKVVPTDLAPQVTFTYHLTLLLVSPYLVTAATNSKAASHGATAWLFH